MSDFVGHKQSHSAARAGEFGWPMGLRREYAAAYCGVSPSKFDEWVKAGLMPRPKRQDRVIFWVRRALDVAIDALPDDGEGASNPWNRVE